MGPNNPKIFIIGTYPSLKKTSFIQDKLCGKIKKINKCWRGRNNICSWIHRLDNGTLHEALNIRDTSKAICVL